MIIEAKIRKPLLRWAGSKRQLLPILRECVPRFHRYIEPFSGSACLYFDLLPRRAILSDYNSELIQALNVLKRSPQGLFFALRRLPQTKAFYYEIRSADKNSLGQLEKAARFFYLNRFCFNGVYRTNRNGDFNVPRGTRTGRLLTLTEMRSFSALLRSAKLVCRDFAEAIQDVQTGDFVYLDPPYARKSTLPTGEYGVGAFSYADLPRLMDLLHAIDQRKARFLLSYADDQCLRTWCKRWAVRTTKVKRHIAGFSKHRHTVRELLIANYPLPEL